MSLSPNQPAEPVSISRTQRKIDLEVLSKLGASLIELPAGKFVKLDLPESLREILVEARRMTSVTARQRHLRHIKLELDRCDVNQIRIKLAQIDRLPAEPKVTAQPAVPTAESTLASSLMEGGDAAVFALSSSYDPSDLQTLRQAVRRARKDLEQGKTREASVEAITNYLARLGGAR